MPITNITIEITEDTRPPSRRHVHVPADDQRVNDWFDSQVNQSASVRLLIHDEISKHGMGDRVTREKFGSAVAQAAAPKPAAPPASAPAASTAPVPTAVPATTAASGMLTLPDGRDDEIVRLQGELARLRSALGPLYEPFVDALSREELVTQP